MSNAPEGFFLSATQHIFKEFNKRKVKFIVVGALATAFYGYMRTTEDADVVVVSGRDNLKKIQMVLKRFHFLPALRWKTLADIMKSEHTLFVNNKFLPVLKFDIITERGLFDWTGLSLQEVWQAKVKGTFRNVPVYYIGRKHWELMKKTAGRERDILDIKEVRRRERLMGGKQ